MKRCGSNNYTKWFRKWKNKCSSICIAAPCFTRSAQASAGDLIARHFDTSLFLISMSRLQNIFDASQTFISQCIRFNSRKKGWLVRRLSEVFLKVRSSIQGNAGDERSFALIKLWVGLQEAEERQPVTTFQKMSQVAKFLSVFVIIKICRGLACFYWSIVAWSFANHFSFTTAKPRMS